MLEFQPFNEFTAMLLSERTQAAARQLIRSIGFDAMRRTTETLRMEGLIGEDCAAHIVLSLMADLDVGHEQVQRLQRLGIDVPEEIAGSDDGHALQAVFGESTIAVEIADEDGGLEEAQRQAREDRLHALEQLRAAKGRAEAKNSKPAQDGEQPTCPICGEPISAGAAGCRKHWRQAKKLQEPEWQDVRMPSDG